MFRLFDFKCDACDIVQERLIEVGEEVKCDKCGGVCAVSRTLLASLYRTILGLPR